MKLSRITLSVALMWIAFSAAAARAADNFNLDSAHSMVVFKVTHLGVGVTFGRFNSPEGKFVLDSADPSKSSFDISVKSENVDTGVEKRDNHLRSPDFFNAKQFPTISFKSTAVKAADNGDLEVTGDLSLHGVTKSITVTLKKIGEGETPAGFRAGFETSFTIKRSDYGMNFMPGGVGDDVTLMVSLEGVKQ